MQEWIFTRRISKVRLCKSKMTYIHFVYFLIFLAFRTNVQAVKLEELLEKRQVSGKTKTKFLQFCLS